MEQIVLDCDVPATSLRRILDDVGRPRAATSQPSNRASPHGITPPARFLTLPVEHGGQGVLWRLGANPLPGFSEQIENCRIMAPCDGRLVFVAAPTSAIIHEGDIVRERQRLFRIVPALP